MVVYLLAVMKGFSEEKNPKRSLRPNLIETKKLLSPAGSPLHPRQGHLPLQGLRHARRRRRRGRRAARGRRNSPSDLAQKGRRPRLSWGRPRRLRRVRRSLLVAERVALNYLQRMSGIATATRAMVSAAASRGGQAIVLDTRKTAPGLRVTDKWGVSIGGGRRTASACSTW